MGSVLSSFSSLMGSVLSSFCSPSLLSLPPAPPPSPPSPPTSSQIKSDVFLSFRGEDTRDNFTSHLRKALVDKQIVTFIDDKLNRGDEISPSLLKAIEESQIAIIIFSQDYASSSRCLEELVKILECRENYGQIVIPVFYKIDPSQLGKQTESFEVAFAKHQTLKENSSQVQKWKDALNLAGTISGFDSRVVKPESILIGKIVQKVLEDLKSSINVSYKGLVGIESKVKDIESCLNDGRSVGIWGMGGIGKTTLANAVYNKIFCQFEGCHFVPNVRETLEKMGPKYLRQELYLAILGDKNAYNHQPTKIRFSRMKLLIILDDVTSIKQVDDLIGDLDCFGLGSRFIITSRDQQVLKNYGVDYIYEVKELSFDNALELFSQYAFKQNCPELGYTELSEGVVNKVGGVPLVLKILGSVLLDKSKQVWESLMKKLEYSVDNSLYRALKISYDGLDSSKKNVFLDIAHFYKGWDINLVIAIMDASGFHTVIELTALLDKSLIVILDNKIMMHDLLQAMGKWIVQQESMDPGERTRLCNHNDIYEVLTKATGTKKIEGISLDMSNTGDIHLHSDAFVNMRNLRFLQFYISDYWSDDNNKVHVLQDLKFSSTKLRYFEWTRCPLTSLPSNSHLENLIVMLKLPYSNVEQLWSGIQQFDHLKEIDLSFSEKLIRLPDLRAPKLEVLDLEGCASLIEIPQLPRSLKFVNLIGCSKLQWLPKLPDGLEELHLQRCPSLIEILSSIQYLTRLESLDLSGCKSLTSIPDCIGLISLRYLDLSHCSKLERLPVIANNFEELNLEGCTRLFEIPSSFKHLNKLKRLILRGCERLQVLPKLPWADIDARDCTSLQKFSCPSFSNDFLALYSSQFIWATFINCFKLDQNSLDSFMKDIQREIQAQSPSYREVYEGKRPPLNICYPGNEIPAWFDFQSTGSFIDVKLPPNRIDYNFLCFALCSVVSFPDQKLPSDFYAPVEYKCYVKSKEGGHNWVRIRDYWNKYYNFAECLIGSSHVIIGFGFHFFRELHDNEFTFQFCGLKDHYKEYCKVEKCGVHLIFGKHIEQSIKMRRLMNRTVQNPRRMMNHT